MAPRSRYRREGRTVALSLREGEGMIVWLIDSGSLFEKWRFQESF
jgi:hypothetical protein